jgi:hypothetical protein
MRATDVTGPGDLNLVGLARLDRGDESGQVGLGVMHLYRHTVALATSW